MNCWINNKNNPANKSKGHNFRFSECYDYGSIRNVIGAIATVSAVAKSQRNKKETNSVEELDKVEE